MKPDFVPDRPIAFNREFVGIAGGIVGALVLSQAVYWSKRTKDRYGWFYKTAQDWKQEIGVTRCELETARKRLIDAGVLDYKKKGVPCKSHYRVKAVELRKRLYSNDNSQFAENQQTRMRKTSKPVCTKPANLPAENQQTNTETTQILDTEINNTDYGTAPDQTKIVNTETGEIYTLGGGA